MGFRFKKSINLGGGVKLNVGKNGVGVSAGVKGLRVSHGADGKTRVTASIPNTGISYQETIGGNKKKEIKKKHEYSAPKQLNESELLYSFQGVLKAIRENGKLVYDEFNRNFYNGNYTISFYIGSVHMIDPNRGELTQHSFVGDVPIRKNIYETGIWVFKGTRIELILEVNGTEFTFEIPSESIADGVIDWHTEFKENWKARMSFVIDEDEGEEEILTNDWDQKVGEEQNIYLKEDEEPLVMSCMNCYTRDEVEDWQLSMDEETYRTKIYCRHCNSEYDSEVSLEWESEFLNPEGNYAFNYIMCGNCDEDISLIGVPFEDEVAYVKCSNCNDEVRITPPS